MALKHGPRGPVGVATSTGIGGFVGSLLFGWDVTGFNFGESAAKG
jgi:hypothetical protein